MVIRWASRRKARSLHARACSAYIPSGPSPSSASSLPRHRVEKWQSAKLLEVCFFKILKPRSTPRANARFGEYAGPVYLQGACTRRHVVKEPSPQVRRISDVVSLDHQHAEVRSALKLPEDFVIQSLRHTMLTRLGEVGADAFTIMRIAGHSSVPVSQRYVHPTPESLERAFEQLDDLNAQKFEEAQSEQASKRVVGIVSGIPPLRRASENRSIRLKP